MTTTSDDAAESRPESESPDSVLERSVDDCPASLAGRGEIGTLLRASWEEQLARGYAHTLREIGQQPVVWPETARLMMSRADEIGRCLHGVDAVVLTGSGSSLYAGDCVAPCLQGALGVPVTTVPGGLILTHPELCLPPAGAYLVVSLARSGNSPESRGAVDWLLETQPRARHLFIACNRHGALATAYGGIPAVTSVVLPDRTDDKSLVMTSSFTSLALAAGCLGALREPGDCENRTLGLARVAADILEHRSDDVAALARSGFGSAVYLGSGCRLGSCREAALKMLEMNAGEVWTLPESFLGLRHGPMSAVLEDTLVVAFLSSDPVVRAYEVDLLRELRRKDLGGRRLIVGAGVPSDLAARPDDVIVDCTAARVGDEELTLIDAVVGQLVAFFRCMDAGFRPDSPSKEDVITRVVSDFTVHRRNVDR